jgi:hypothetical protein
MRFLASVRAPHYFRSALKTLENYCDMTPESRSSPLPDNGPLARIPAATDRLVKVKALPRIDTRFRGNEY